LKISTKGRYGLRAMLDLALNSAGGHVSLAQIAERQELSVRYLEQMFSALRKAGLVKSVKGAQGGYSLAALPGEITAGEILRVLEGDLLVTDSAGSPVENLFEQCLDQSVYRQLNEGISRIVDGITLEDLMEDFQKLDTGKNFIYYI